MNSKFILIILSCTFVYSNKSMSSIEPKFLETVSSMVETSPDFLIKKAKSTLDEKESSMFFKSLLPTVDIGAQVSKDDLDVFNNNKTSGYLSSELNLFSGFKDFSKYQIQSIQAQISALELVKTQSSLEANYSLILIEYLGTLKAHEIKSKFLNIKKDSMLISKMSFRKGAISKQEYSKALIDYQNSIASHESSRMKLEEALGSVKEIKSDFDTLLVWPFDGLANELKHSLKKSINRYENNIEFKIGELKSKKSNKILSNARSSYYPTLDLSLKLSRSLDRGTSGFDKRSVLSLNFPLFSGGRDESKVRATKYEEYFLIMKNEKLRLSLTAKYSLLKGNLLRALDSLKIRKETLSLSRTLYSDNFKRFKKGHVHINDFHVDQNRLLESEKLFNQGQYSFHKEVIRYCELLAKPIATCFK